MDILQNNERILAKCHPVVYKNILSENGFSEWILEGNKISKVVYSNCDKTGISNCDKTEIVLSPYGQSKSKILNLWIDQLKIEQNCCNVVTGFGTGDHIRELLKRIDSSSLLIIGEYSVAWLKYIFSKIDCSDILSDKRVCLITGNLTDDDFGQIQSLNLFFRSSLQPFIFSPLYELNSSYYDKFLSKFLKYFEFFRQLQQTNIIDSPLWQQKTLINLPILFDSADVSETKDLFKDLSIVFVSAGPSLDESIEFLLEVQKKGLIVCVNSSYRKLIKSGIIPHITLAADPRYSTFLGYENCPTDETFLFCSYFVHQNVTRAFSDRIFTWSRENQLLKLLSMRSNFPKEHTSIFEEGTISATIGDFCKIWGSKKIFLAGQDLAILESGQTHTLDSFYADHNHVFKSLENCHFLPGNTKKAVPVENTLLVYLKTFDKMTDLYPEIQWFNTSVFGAKIRNIPFVNFSEAVKMIGSKEFDEHPIDRLRNVLSNFKNSKKAKTFSCNNSSEKKFESADSTFEKSEDLSRVETKKSISQTLQPIKKFSEIAFKMSLELAIINEFLPEKYSSLNYENSSLVRESLKLNNKLANFIQSNQDDFGFLSEGKLKGELIRWKELCKIIPEDQPNHWKIIQKSREFAWSMAEGSIYAICQLNDCIQKDFYF